MTIWHRAVVLAVHGCAVADVMGQHRRTAAVRADAGLIILVWAAGHVIGSHAPYDWFPYAALAIVVVATAYGLWLNRRDPALGDRVVSIVADE